MIKWKKNDVRELSSVYYDDHDGEKGMGWDLERKDKKKYGNGNDTDNGYGKRRKSKRRKIVFHYLFLLPSPFNRDSIRTGMVLCRW